AMAERERIHRIRKDWYPSEFASNFLKEVQSMLGEMFVFGVAFQSCYCMVLYYELQLLRRLWFSRIPRWLNYTISIGLIIIGVNISLLTGPWLLRRYGINMRIIAVQYLGAISLFTIIPTLLISISMPYVCLIFIAL